jgi:hypothetical protein
LGHPGKVLLAVRKTFKKYDIIQVRMGPKKRLEKDSLPASMCEDISCHPCTDIKFTAATFGYFQCSFTSENDMNKAKSRIRYKKSQTRKP